MVGLLIIAAGCLMFIPASSRSLYGLFLVALFVLGSGITTVQVVANPLISLLGPTATTSSRLTFAQAFNSLGTTLFPYVGSILILGGLSKVDATRLVGDALAQFRTTETHVVVITYLGLAIALVILAALVFSGRKALTEGPADTTPILRAFALLARPRFGFGALCIFLYVGAEVAIGSMMVSYLMDSGTLGLTAADAGQTRTVLLGRRHGRAFFRRVSIACNCAMEGTRGCCSDCKLPAADLGKHRRGSGRLVADCHRLVQFDHVSHDIFAGERGLG